MKNIKEKKCKNCMTEEKLIKTKLEIEAKEYEQKQGYKGLLDALYEEGQNKGYECARSYITPYIIRAYIAGATEAIKELEGKLMDKVCLESLDIVSEKIKQLEKENAELKLKLEALDGQIPWKDIKDKSEVIGKLTKAKEILKSLYFIIESRIDYKNNIGVADEMWRAKQFWQGE